MHRRFWSPSLAGKMAETTGVWEHNESDIDIAEDWELISLFDESISSFRECDLSICVVFYSLNLQFNTTHSFSFSFSSSLRRRRIELENFPRKKKLETRKSINIKQRDKRCETKGHAPGRFFLLSFRIFFFFFFSFFCFLVIKTMSKWNRKNWRVGWDEWL